MISRMSGITRTVTLSAWTIHVKCKIVSVGPAECIVRITGDSLQFRRGEIRSIPIGYIHRNGK